MGKTTDPDAVTDLTSLFDAAKSGKLLTTTNGAGQAGNITVRGGLPPNHVRLNSYEAVIRILRKS